MYFSDTIFLEIYELPHRIKSNGYRYVYFLRVTYSRPFLLFPETPS